MQRMLFALVTGTVALAACGDNRAAPVDAAPVVHPDAGPPDAAVGITSITLADDEGPLVGQRAIYQDPSGVVVATPRTDANGTARAPLPRGGTVTVIDELADPIRLFTYVGVVAGDALQANPVVPTLDQLLTVTAPLDPGAVAYQADACGFVSPLSTQSGVPSQLVADFCRGPTGNVAVYSIAADGSVRALVELDAAIGSGGAGAVTLTGAYAPTIDVTSVFTGLPLGAPRVDNQSYLATPHEPLGYIDAFSTPVAGVVSARFSQAAVDGFTQVDEISFQQNAKTTQRIATWGPPNRNPTLDVSTVTLPAITDDPTFDLATRAVQWVPGDGVAPDFTIVQIGVIRGTQSWLWDIAQPYIAGAAVYPSLPSLATGFDYNPASGDTVDVGQLRTGKITGGYDAVRAGLLTGFGEPGTQITVPFRVGNVFGTEGQAVGMIGL